MLDLFAGTMKTAMAAMRLNCNSISVEVDVNCQDAAMGRLRRYYKYLKMLSLLVSRTSGVGVGSVAPSPVESSRGFEGSLRQRKVTTYPLGTVPTVIPETVEDDAALIGNPKWIYPITSHSI